MMDRQDIAYAIGSAAAFYGLYYIVAALSFPTFFLRATSVGGGPEGAFYDRWQDKIHRWSRNTAGIIGVGYFVYRATAPLVDWMPFSWGSHDDDGEWQSLRDATRMVITPVGVIWLLVACENAAKALKGMGRQ